MSTEKEDTSTSKATKDDTTDTTKPNESTEPNPTKRNTKKRSLEEMQNDSDDDSEDDDIISPSPPATKKRKLDVESKEEETGTEEPFKICCYNLNGIRASAKNGLEDYIQKEDADIVCFSEMKAKQSQNPCEFRGYELIWCECTDKAGYSGTAVLSKTKPLSIVRGIGSADGEGRAITLEFDRFYLINTYVPNSGQGLKFKTKRLKWDEAMKQWIKDLQEKKPVIWTGDLNVAILDFDVYDGETNKNRKKSPGFTPYERENFRNILDELDLVDSYRHLYPKERDNHFTFFTKRSRATDMKKANKGWRLDYFV
eukprot:142734_1